LAEGRGVLIMIVEYFFVLPAWLQNIYCVGHDTHFLEAVLNHLEVQIQNFDTT
jgi:hypothetical protein